MLRWKKIASTIAFLIGFGLVSLTVHEFFHYVTVQALNGVGFITYDRTGGYTWWAADTDYVWLIQLSGGLFTGIFFLLFFWLLPFLSNTKHDTNIEVAAFCYGLGNLVYAPSEILTQHSMTGALIFSIGFAAGMVLYFTKISNWMYK